MARPRDSSIRRSILAAIAQLTFDSQKPGKKNSNVEATADEFKEQVEKYPGWRGLPGSPRSIYSLLKKPPKTDKP